MTFSLFIELFLLMLSVLSINGFRYVRKNGLFRTPSSYIQLRSLRMQSSPLTELLVPSKEDKKLSQFVFVGGKGGVGKTSSSSAIALSFSDSGLKTLIVSTDPAHSLGDALDINLTSGEVVPVVTETNLWALEIDVEAALNDFRESVSDLNSESIANSLGVPKNIIDSLGIDDIASIFTNPPPGIDEIVGLAKIFNFANQKDATGKNRFDRIVIDTAPTGHTVRLLQLPEFLNSLTGKLFKFRAKLLGAIDTFKGLFGGSSEESGGNKMLSLLDKLETLQESVLNVKNTLKDSSKTQFVIVTIPTQLAVTESKRLATSLNNEGIKVSTIICNQVIGDLEGHKYVKNRAYGQQKCINQLENFVNTGLRSSRTDKKIEITKVPYVDTEVTGLFGLKYFHSLAHLPKAKTATNPVDSRKFTIFGGKGGVGKTTSAASWAVRLADSGFKTLVVSSDPAHSLGDALQIPLTGVPKRVDDGANLGSFSLPGASSADAPGGELWAMEIDPQEALKDFREAVQSYLAKDEGASESSGGGMMAAVGMSDLKGDLADLVLGIKDPPPGTDEVVALTNIVKYLQKGFTTPDGRVVKFDRVVLDTAPTGHTLRMLQLPPFLVKLIQKFKSIKEKTDFASKFGGSGKASGGEAPKKSGGRLDQFETRMRNLDILLHSAKECEFTAVTIPTELAASETQRLLKSLEEDNILCRRVIMNQIIPTQEEYAGDEEKESRSSAYLNKLRAGQQKSIQELRTMAEGLDVPLINVPYFDMEVRTVYGLRVISNVIFPPKKT